MTTAEGTLQGLSGPVRRLDVEVWLGPGGGRMPAHLELGDAAVTVADLAQQLGAGPTWLAVDGRPCSPTATLAEAGVRQGSLVAVPPGLSGPPDSPEHGPYLAAETGLDAGRVFPLEIGSALVGRSDLAQVPLTQDPLASRDHCRLEVSFDGTATAVDLGSTNGTSLNGLPLTGPTPLSDNDLLTVGSTALRFRVGRRAGASSGTPGATDGFRRPPRRPPPAPPAPGVLPEPPDVREPKPTLPIVAFVTPMLFAVVMVVALHSFLYAIFGFLSPVAAAGTYLDGKRRYRKAKRGKSGDTKAALDELAAQLERQRLAAIDRLAAVAGSPAELRDLAATTGPTLWERRRSHADFTEVRLATGAVPFAPVVESARAPIEAAQQVIDEVAGRGVGVAALTLDGRWVGVCGDRAASLAVARSLVLQAATTSGPADLRVRLAVGPEHVAEWEWARWLPHAGADEDGAGATAAAELWIVDDPADGPPAGAATALALAADFHGLPDRCQVVVNVDANGILAVEDLVAGSTLRHLTACGVGADVADSWARSLAPVQDGDLPAGRLPDVVNACDLVRWAGPGAGLVWPLGEGRAGPVGVDLAAVPHVVVAGVTGSGTSGSIQNLVAGLARYGPDRVNVAVVDLAGGEHSRLAAFPHVAGVTETVGSLRSGEGPLVQLESEVLRRERLVRGGGFDTLDDYVAGTGEPVPHLVVAVDDAGTLPADQHAALEAMARLCAASTNLGLHMVLATRQPAGRPAILLRDSAARVALRLDERSAVEFVGVPHPARLPPQRPGRGWMALPGGPAEAVQLAATGVPAPAGGRHLRVDLHAGLGWAGRGGASALDAILAEATARFPHQARPLWGAPPAAESAQTVATLSELLGVADLHDLDPAVAWAERDGDEYLRVPIGVDEYGLPALLDLKEAAFGGMGPHGLVVGATGSGKSELLRTLVSALVARHSPEQLSLVLVDFKGGATFAPFVSLPHIAGLITNLESDLSNVDRMEAALLGEQQRRQELLRRAGNLGSADAYRRLRSTQPSLPPLPELLVVVDEFAELLEQRPEFINMFGSIGRLGRSLGLHLLLATQRLDEGRLRGLESHLRYRISLRTNSAAESRSVLGLPDAAMLPSEPGFGYIRVDEPKLRRFRAALVSQPVGAAGAASDMELLVDRLRQAAPPTHQVWLPVLPASLSLGRLLGPLTATPERGLQAADWEQPGAQRTPIGVIDRPRLQTRAALVADFSGATGNLLVIGSPRSGKTTLLRTLVASLALTHTPEEVHVYGLDFAGGGLLPLAGLPHVGGVAHQADPELAARTVAHVATVVDRREAMFRQAGIHSAEQFRRLRIRGELPPGDHGDVYLIVDGWDSLRATSDVLEERLTDVARRGLAVGVHLVVAATRWPVVRPALRDAALGRLELRQSEPFESLFNRRAAENVPVGAPGRGITPAGEHFLAAAPVLEEAGDEDAGWAALVRAVAHAWPKGPAPRVPILPSQLRLADVPHAGPGIAIGLAEPDMDGFALDLTGRDQHLLVLGDSGAGKTTVLRTVLRQLTAGRGPHQVKVLLVDPRRTLMDAVPEELRFGYAGSAPAAAAEILRFREALDRRLPGPEITLDQLRERSWWEGPEAFLVVDDHDLVVTPTSNPLMPMLDLLAQASDVGLHVIVARRVAGWQRAQFEPVLQRLREVSATTLLLSGEPSEGVITAGVRAVPRPPGRATLVRYREAPVTVQVAC